MNEQIAASIVTFNPDLQRLRENINAIYPSVSMLVIVDNNSKDILEVKKEYRNFNKVFFIENDENVGIAKALNQAMEYSKQKGFSWVLTLDQDSVCPPNIIHEFKKFLGDPAIAMITPNIRDRNVSNYQTTRDTSQNIEYVSKCITSATLTRVTTWLEVGGFDERMFIDFVDFDYCKRVIDKNYKILKVNNVVLLHEIGNISIHKFFKWQIKVKNHSAFRKYYMTRNIIYYAKKHKENKRYLKASLRITKLTVLTVMFEKEKISKVKKIFKGAGYGFKMKC